MSALIDRARVHQGAIALAAMAAGGDKAYNPSQVLKLVFLVDRANAPRLFSFEPGAYGPTSREVFTVLEAGWNVGLIDRVVDRSGIWRNFRLTKEGRDAGEAVLAEFSEKTRDYFQGCAEYVLRLSFCDLNTAVVKAYPEMRSA